MTINLETNDMKNKKIPIRIIYYNDKNPLTTTGGVQTFARGLKSIFDRVEYMIDFDSFEACGAFTDAMMSSEWFGTMMKEVAAAYPAIKNCGTRFVYNEI